MGATPFVILLVGLALPIIMILGAILFDIAVLIWAAHRVWHDRLAPALVRAVRFSTARIPGYRFLQQ